MTARLGFFVPDGERHSNIAVYFRVAFPRDLARHDGPSFCPAGARHSITRKFDAVARTKSTIPVFDKLGHVAALMRGLHGSAIPWPPSRGGTVAQENI